MKFLRPKNLVGYWAKNWALYWCPNKRYLDIEPKMGIKAKKTGFCFLLRKKCLDSDSDSIGLGLDDFLNLGLGLGIGLVIFKIWDSDSDSRLDLICWTRTRTRNSRTRPDSPIPIGNPDFGFIFEKFEKFEFAADIPRNRVSSFVRDPLCKP